MPVDQHSTQNQQQTGVLLHISSLPSAGYIGDLGADAWRMADVLAQMQVRVWQTLPINMPHGDRSPYQCISAFAGDIELISLEALKTEKLLTATQIKAFYASGKKSKLGILSKAYKKFITTQNQARIYWVLQK